MRCGLRVRGGVDDSIDLVKSWWRFPLLKTRTRDRPALADAEVDAKPSAPTSLIFGLTTSQSSIAVEHPIPPRQRQPATPSQWAPTDSPTYVRSIPRTRCWREENWTDKIMQRRRMPYNTKSNKVRIIKTPGGELRYLHLKKRGTAPKCGDCGTKLPGVCLNPDQSQPARAKRTIS